MALIEQQRAAADDPADERVVVADDRVLHRVREQEQHDEVERIELRQLAFAGESKSAEEKRVDGDRPEELLGDRNAGREEVGHWAGSGEREAGTGAGRVRLDWRARSPTSQVAGSPRAVVQICFS